MLERREGMNTTAADEGNRSSRPSTVPQAWYFGCARDLVQPSLCGLGQYRLFHGPRRWSRPRYESPLATCMLRHNGPLDRDIW